MPGRTQLHHTAKQLRQWLNTPCLQYHASRSVIRSSWTLDISSYHTRPRNSHPSEREGPFKVTDVLGPTTVQLDLPRTWRIHPVFHTSLLRPYHTTKEHGPNYVTPPPDLVDTQEEYEVESIINHRKPARGGLQYLVTWRNAPPHENQWLRESALRNASTILRAYKRAHHLA